MIAASGLGWSIARMRRQLRSRSAYVIVWQFDGRVEALWGFHMREWKRMKRGAASL
jgi:hypothetical protein